MPLMWHDSFQKEDRGENFSLSLTGGEVRQ